MAQTIGLVTDQDGLDGRALRKLREAVRAYQYVAVFDGAGGFTVEVHEFNGSHEAASVMESGEGTTVAEAADKCRAALPPDVAKLRNEGTI